MAVERGSWVSCQQGSDSQLTSASVVVVVVAVVNDDDVVVVNIGLPWVSSLNETKSLVIFF